MKEKTNKIAVKDVIAVAVILAAEIFFFSEIIFSEKMPGDLGDGRFVPLITDHWWKFFTGRERFGEIPIFYPYTHALGYSDFHFGYGIIYSILRVFGMDLYGAFKWCIILIHAAGSLVMYYLLRNRFKAEVLWALCGTAAFSYCPALSGISNHPQLFAAAMLPELLLFFTGFVQGFESRKKRNVYAYLTVVWFVLLTYTSWYMACFTGIFVLIALIVWLILLGRRENKTGKMIKGWFKTMGLDSLGWLAALVILFIPFLSIYIPVLKEGSFYGFDPTYLPMPVHLLNVGSDNLLMGWFVKLIKAEENVPSNEFTEGFSVAMIVCFFAAAVMLFKKKKKKHDISDCIPKSVVITVIVCVLLMLKWNEEGDSLWSMVYDVIIPARAIHAVVRFLLWLTFPISLIIATTLSKAELFKKKTVGTVAAAAVLVLVFLFTVNKGGLICHFERTERTAFMDAVAEPPADMNAFFVMDSAMSGKPEYVYQLDAYEIASKYDLKTMNGYSGHFPAGWGVWSPCSEDYFGYAADWAASHGLSSVYVYDEAANAWYPFQTE
ncbi:MAG: YfhO family protein [Lachnospiraceae bacterium]|nr:YfhO family protein [Lachnospiraceae bacterium]